MGFSLKKVVKSVTKPLKKVSSAVGKIASGKVSEGLGDIGQAGAGLGLDIVTGGNKKMVDGLSGGLLTSAESAARGNLKDATRLGATAGATIIGGPAGGLAVNQVFAAGGGIQDAGLAYLSGGIPLDGGNMDLSSLLNNSALQGLASQAITSFAGKPKAPKAAPVQQIVAAPPAEDDTKKYLLIGGGVLAAIMGIILMVKLLRNKGK